MRRLIGLAAFLAGLALLGSRDTIGFGVMLSIGGALMFGRTPERNGEDRFIGLVLLIGAIGALAVVVSYFTARP